MVGDLIRVLVVDDDEEDAELVEELLQQVELWRPEVSWASTYDAGVEALRTSDVDVCLLDYRLGARSGVEFLEEAVVRDSLVPVIMLTGLGTSDVDRSAWEAGAADFLAKDGLTLTVLERSIRYAVERSRRRRERTRFEVLRRNSQEWVAVLTEDGTVRYASPSSRRAVGSDPEAWVGRDFFSLVHDDDRADVAEALAGVASEEGGRRHLQYRVRHGDGQWRVMDGVVENYLDHPDVRGVVCSSWDMTERLEQDRRIRFQASVLRAVGQAVVATDLDGRIKYWNPAAEHLYGWRSDEVIDRDLAEVTPSTMRSGQAQAISAAMDKGEAWFGEFEVRRRDGSTFLAMVTETPILDSGGEPIGLIRVSSDISAARQTEAALEKRMRELQVLYRVGLVLHEEAGSLEERLRLVIQALPEAWLHPEVTEIRLVLGDTEVATEGFRETPRMQSSEIRSGGALLGHLDVALTEERPQKDEGPFLSEERTLLDTVARTIGAALERDRLTLHLSQTIASLEEAVLVVDSRERGRGIRSVNPATERIFGFAADEMIGQPTRIIHVDDDHFRRFGAEVFPTLERDGVFHATYPLRRKDGSVFEAEQTVTLLDPTKGLGGGVVSVVRDVSDAVRAERELLESEERFRQLAEHIEDVFWVRSADGQGVEYVSPAYREVWGRDPQELYDDPGSWLAQVHPDDRPDIADRMAHRWEDASEREYRIVRPDGTVRWIHDRAFPVTDADGHLDRVVGVAEDITQRKQAEERFGVLSQEVTDVIFVIGPSGTVTFTTPSVQDVLGYSRAEFEGMRALGLLHEDDRSGVRQVLKRITAEPGATARATFRVRTKSGTVRTLESVARNLRDHISVGGILITARDVTERIELEEKLRHGQRMEAIGQLAGGVAHDFNNLLTVIRSQIDLLLQDLDASAPAAREMEVIQAAADRAAKLTSQLLAFGREQMLRPRVVDITRVVAGVGELIDRVIGETVTVQYRLEEGLPPIEVDPHQLEQVLLNLAVNARDAMPDGGTLTLATSEEVVDDRMAESTPGVEAGHYTVVRVSDTGVGMDDDTRARAFEPFFSTKGLGKGTGLGLSMAYGVVNQSGGVIHVESEPGRGATFVLRFPALEGATQALEPEPTRDGVATAGDGRRVVVIEDDLAVGHVVKKILGRAGYDVTVVGDAETGLERVQDGVGVDLVLTDLVLPGMSGRELVDRLLEVSPEVKIVVMSGYAPGSGGENGTLPIDIPFVQKPFSPEGLVEVVGRALQGG